MRNHARFNEHVVRPVYLADIDSPAGALRMSTADRNISLGGNIFTGVGALGSVGDYSATTGTAPTALRLTLTSIPKGLTLQLSDQQMRNRLVKVYIALLDPAAQFAEADDSFLWFRGRVDTFSLNVGRMTTATLTATSRLIHWANSTNARYTNEDQQKKFPDDDGLTFLSGLATAKILWGS